MYTCVYIGFLTSVILMRCKGQYTPTLKPSPRAEVIAGNELVLICAYDGPENVTVCIWNRNSSTVGFLRLLDTGCTVYQSLANTTLYNATCLGNNMFKVLLKDVKKESHETRWNCEMRIEGSYFKSNPSEMYVVVPVASVTFEPPSSQHLTLDENSTYQAQCRTTPARPLAVISWRNDSKTRDLLDDDKDVTAEVRETTETKETMITTILTVKGSVGIYDNGISLYCTASNVGGVHVISSQRIYINVEYKPDMPLKFLCLNDSVTSNSAILFWQSGDDGGERPTYVLELLTTDITKTILHTPEDADDHHIFYTLSELNADTSYTVRLTAINSAGSSSSQSVQLTTHLSEGKPVSTALTVTTSALGSAMFILIVVLLILCFRKQCANVLSSKGTEDMKLDPLQTQRGSSYMDLTRPSPGQDNQYDTINAASTM